jgi:hypothetical protein
MKMPSGSKAPCLWKICTTSRPNHPIRASGWVSLASPGRPGTGRLAQVVLITRAFAIIMVLLVEALTEKRDVSGIRMRDLSAGSGPQRIDHSSSAHHKGKAMEAVHAVQPHGQVAGYVKPKGDVLFFPRRGIALGKLLKNLVGPNEAKKLRLEYLAGGLHVLKVPVAKGIQNKGLVFLENDQVHLKGGSADFHANYCIPPYPMSMPLSNRFLGYLEPF